MNYVAISLIFLLSGVMCCGMEFSLDSLESGAGTSFSAEVAQLKKMGLISEGERDLEEQIEGLNEDQKNRLLAGQTKRCGVQSGGGLWSIFFGSQHAHSDGEALYLLRDLHRIALEQQEELERSSRRLKIFLVLMGTGLLGSLGANGGLLSQFFSGG